MSWPTWAALAAWCLLNSWTIVTATDKYSVRVNRRYVFPDFKEG